MQIENSATRFYFLSLIITISLGIFTPQAFAQSIFSGLILSEKKDGLKVVDTQKGSPGFDAGLKIGDMILEIDGKKIESLDDYIKISKEAKDKKVEAALTVLRKGILYEAVIRIYSIPVHQHWNQKVTKPKELPRGLTNSPYEHWIGKGNRTLKISKITASFKSKVKTYNEAINYLYYGLHYQPESIDTALQIAKAHHELGSLYLNNGNIKDGTKNYKNSIKLYVNCLKKTQKEDYLKPILSNLQEIEKGLSKIDVDKVKLSETKK
ncbi:MAG: PDZ domain-containing protein [Planctomycetota bacterium]|jgi:membrane-associated protease RseP (regulator of RpoE activity)